MWELTVFYTDTTIVGLLNQLSAATSDLIGQYNSVAECNQALKDTVSASINAGWEMLDKGTNEYTHAIRASIEKAITHASLSCDFDNNAQYNGW